MFIYDGARKAGISLIALTALSSLLSIAYLFVIHRPTAKTFKSTHLFGYFTCLLVANVIQSVGTMIDFEWIAKGGVVEGFACSLQGGLKQAGNLSASFWSLVICVHIFLLLFFKIRSNRATFIALIVLTWTVVLLIPLIGRFVLQRPELGPYYGIAGEWCWITSNYQDERIFLECVFALFTIVISSILYIAIFLRFRGNLVEDKNIKWKLRLIGRGGAQNFAGGDEYAGSMDRAMTKIAKNMIWYPVSYTAIMLPMTIIRIVELKYNSVPFALTAVSGIIFNSMGLVNVILLLYISRAFQQLDTLPQVSPSREYYKRSMEKTREGSFYDRKGSHEQYEDLVHDSLPRLVKVTLPTKPAGTYVAPDSWKTGSPGGKIYG
ncbi:hypothetical protein BJ912DRAFT_965883 [Pholiota molesta]|nr:hypothetical protein BJ912DRAFT_965883 [Pholiota molesta]